MKKYSFLLVFLLSVSLFGCKDRSSDPLQARFLDQEEIGAYKDGEALFVYDDKVHQKAYDPQNFKFLRIQTDDQGKFLHILFTERPTMGVGQQITVEVVSRGIGIESGMYQVDVKKKRDRTLWLWDSDKKWGFIVD